MTAAMLMRPRSRWGLRLLAMAVLAACGAVVLGVEAFQAQQAGDEARLRGDRLLARQRSAQQAPSRADTDLQRLWGVLAADRSFPWPRVFGAIEHAVDPEVALLEFRPDRQARVLTLKGEASSSVAIARYVDLLSRDAALARVHLVRQADVVRGPLKVMEFEIRARIAD